MQAAAKHKFPRCGVSKSKMLSCYISIRCIPTMTNEDEILENPCKSFITVITCRPAQTNIKSTGQYTVPPIPADLCRLQQVHELLFGICPLKIIQSFNHSITQSLNHSIAPDYAARTCTTLTTLTTLLQLLATTCNPICTFTPLSLAHILLFSCFSLIPCGLAPHTIVVAKGGKKRDPSDQEERKPGEFTTYLPIPILSHPIPSHPIL